MKIIVFEAEEREAAIFGRIKRSHAVKLVADPLDADNARGNADAEVSAARVDAMCRALPAEFRRVPMTGRGSAAIFF